MLDNEEYYPRTDLESRPIENPGEVHVLAPLVIDTSGSVDGEETNKGIKTTIKGVNNQAKGRVEFCVIGFSDIAKVLAPFGPAYDYEMPTLTFGGTTAMHAAIDLALEVIEERKKELKMNKTPYLRPIIMLITDGKPNDPDNGAFERLKQAQREKHCTLIPIAIGNNADTELLKGLSIKGTVIKASEENFANVFNFLCDSINQISQSNPGETIKLPDPRDYQLEIEV